MFGGASAGAFVGGADDFDGAIGEGFVEGGGGVLVIQVA